MKFRTLVAIFILYRFCSTNGQFPSDWCFFSNNCEECIRRPNCSWCFENSVMLKNRCFQKHLTDTRCAPKYILAPESSTNILNLVIDSSKTYTTEVDLVSVNLSVGNPATVTTNYVIKGEFTETSVEVDLTTPVGVKATIMSKCTEYEEIVTNACRKVKPEDPKQFKIVFELENCPTNPHLWNQSTSLYIRSKYGEKHVILNINLLCSCPCESSNFKTYKKNDRECFHNGDLSCGICKCSSGYFGRRCECSSNSYDYQINTCIMPNSTLECSGRGVCAICNRCECEEREARDEVIYGIYCECDNFSCGHHHGQICSGHGKCDCGICECEEPWTGPTCDFIK